MANDLPNLGADFELWGHWWLPEHESDKVTGCLSCRGGNLELKLLGQFDAVDVNRLHATVPVIHGVGDTKVFTLWNAIQGQFGFRSPGTVEQHFAHMRVLAGRLLSDRSQVAFTGLSLHAANLGPWSGIRPVVCTLTMENSIDVSYQLAEKRSAEIALPDQRMVLTIGSSYSTRNEEFSSYGFDVFPSLHVEFQAAKYFEDVIVCAGSLQRILSLLIGVELIAGKAAVEIDGGKQLDNVLGLLVEHAPPDDQEPLNAHEVLIPFAEISAQGAEVFARWFIEEPRIKDAVELFLGTIRRRSLPTPTELTALAQALETFHRNVYGGNYMSSDAYEPVSQAISAAIPTELDEGHREALRSRIKYGYQFSFRKRMAQLVRGFDKELLTSLDIDGGTFPGDVADARNYFTHWDAAAGAAKMSGVELSNLVSKLKAFTRLVLLSHLGVPAELVRRRILNNTYLYLPKAVPIDWS